MKFKLSNDEQCLKASRTSTHGYEVFATCTSIFLASAYASLWIVVVEVAKEEVVV